jgi:hypothetical protein
MNLELPAAVQTFIAEKERQVNAAAEKYNVEVWAEVADYFAAAKKGDAEAADDLFKEVRRSARNPQGTEDENRASATALAATLEVELALEQFTDGEPKYLEAFGRGIIESIPAGGVYFGGTDPGRGLPTAYCKSHSKGDPIFVQTQNALADGTYLIYLRDMYGGKLYVPTEEDSKKAFKEYIDDAQRRLEHDEKFPDEPRQIRPGENVQKRDNRVNVSGQIAVMSINGLLAKLIFDRNPDREFFIEESFPLDWMYPHLSPHGLILKLNRKPLAALSEETVKQDRKFWSEQQRKMIGNWLKPETPVRKVCDFAQAVFVDKDLDDYEVDPKFVRNANAGKTYSKLRSSSGGVYAWRARQAEDALEKKRMLDEADFAFRQAFAFYPGSPEAVFRYVNLLVEQKRFDDALRLAETSAKADSFNGHIRTLFAELERRRAGDRR